MRRLDILRIAPFRALRNREPDIVLRPRRPDPLIAGMAREVALDGAWVPTTIIDSNVAQRFGL